MAKPKTDRPKRTRSQIGRSSRRKGHTFERWVSNQLKAAGFTDAHRQPQSQIKLLKEINATLPDGQKRALTDVVAGCFAIECKHRKVLPKLEDTLKQAEEDSAGSGFFPVAVHKGGSVKSERGCDIIVGVDSALMSNIGGLGLIHVGRILLMTWKEFLERAQAMSLAYSAYVSAERAKKSAAKAGQIAMDIATSRFMNGE